MIKSISVLSAGYCTHNERITMKKGAYETVEFPAIFGLIQHETHGNILFDTGYAPRYFEETQKFPNKLYAMVTPVHIERDETAAAQLSQLGIKPEDIQYIIISHFHADHICGLKDFINAKYIYKSAAYQTVLLKNTFEQIRRGFLKGLIPKDFEERSLYVENLLKIDLLGELGSFSEGYDLFSDGSIYLIDLEGHAKGQIGAFVTCSEQKYFFVADAVWQSRAFEEILMPSRLAYGIMDDSKAYEKIVLGLHEVYRTQKNIKIVPSHCKKVLSEVSHEAY